MAADHWGNSGLDHHVGVESLTLTWLTHQTARVARAKADFSHLGTIHNEAIGVDAAFML